LRPTLLPFALACARPSLVRVRISSRSNSARPPRTVSISGRAPWWYRPMRRRATGSRLLLGNRRKRVQQVAGRASEAVEPRHHHHVAQRRLRRAAGQAGDGQPPRRSLLPGTPCRRRRREVAGLARQRSGRRSRRGHNCKPSHWVSGRCAPVPWWRALWRTDGASAWVFHATDLRSAQSLDAPRLAECCLSL